MTETGLVSDEGHVEGDRWVRWQGARAWKCYMQVAGKAIYVGEVHSLDAANAFLMATESPPRKQRRKT